MIKRAMGYLSYSQNNRTQKNNQTLSRFKFESKLFYQESMCGEWQEERDASELAAGSRLTEQGERRRYLAV